MMKFLSVIIPVYNSEDYITRCLNSVIRQYYSNIEIIIVNDGSTDNTLEICKLFQKNDKRIKIISEGKHNGVCITRKSGIKAASGEYIVFVDSDDWIEEDCLEKRMADINDADVVLSGYYTEREDMSPAHYPLIDPGIYDGKRIEYIWDHLFMIKKKYVYAVLWSNIYKTSKMQEIIDYIPDELIFYEDYCMTFLMLLEKAKKVNVVKNVGYHNCVNVQSTTSQDHRDEYLKTLHLYYNFLWKTVERHLYKDVLSKNLREYLRNLFRYEVPAILRISDNYSNIYYPYYGRLINKKIVLYGAGKIGQAYYQYIIKERESVLVAWVDRNYLRYNNSGLTKVNSPDIILQLEYDYIIIGVADINTAEEIKAELNKYGILENKILWNKTKFI